MNKNLVIGQDVKLKPSDDLKEVFKKREFFNLDEKFMEEIAKKIGGTSGKVSFIEEKYSKDYFLYKTDAFGGTFSIPYESVDFGE